ncbi:lipid-transfer protein [soil metagenome]
MPSRLNAAIVGLGMAGLTRTEALPASMLAANAIHYAIEDAGLARADIDGLILNRSGAASEQSLNLHLASLAGLRDLRLSQVLLCDGASSLASIQTAAMAVSLCMAKHVAVVFADAALKADKRISESFGRIKPVEGIAGLRYSAGLIGGAAAHALVASRYMHEHGVSERELGEVAVSTRRWAALNPQALFRKPLSIDEYLASRYVAEPFRLFDCAIPVNGAIAVIVSAASSAHELKQPPVHILGVGQGHGGQPDQRGFADAVEGGRVSAAMAYDMAGLAPRDVTQCQIYDAFSINTLLMLEMQGLCGEGEAAALVGSGATSPGGRLPVNTGGGHLSGYYMQGMTPIAEAVLQVRGHAGQRQARSDVVLVTNEGGLFDHHACMLVGPKGC